MREELELKRLAVLTSSSSWFLSYAKQLVNILKWLDFEAYLFTHHTQISSPFDVLFILSYFNRVPREVLNLNKFNLVVHESDLPKGKGWAPLFWQILEGKNRIPVVLFEATEEIDAGRIYLKDFIELEGHELHDEIREKQAHKTIELCLKFLRKYPDLIPEEQKGEESFYPRRTPADSELDVDKTIREQFNLLRIVDNENYPAFFVLNGHRYILKIYKADNYKS